MARPWLRGLPPSVGGSLKKPAPLLTPAQRKGLPAEVREKIAMAQLENLEEEEKLLDDDQGEPPEEAWKAIPGMLGMPVEIEAAEMRSLPWMTWGLVLAMGITLLLTVGNLADAVKEWGLIPDQFWRHGGATFLTSFFLHGGPLHLLVNGYFLLIFGYRVEDELGRPRYLLLLALSALFGDVAHILMDPHSGVPCIGASGGISGVIAFYALRFPDARLGLFLRTPFAFRWVRLRAVYAFILWLLLQFVAVAQQLAGIGNVSALAHLGGCLIGVAAFLIWRFREKPAASPPFTPRQ